MDGGTHEGEATAAVASPGPAQAPPEFLEFADVYRRYFHEVQRWARALGVPASEREDLAQEVFVVVRRKLHAFDGRNLGGWLFRITERTASDHRRRGWFKHLFQRRAPDALERLEWGGPGPAESLERRERQQALAGVLARMSEKRRTAFVLFEIEGYSGEEIAQLLRLPVATVWTRLHHARKDFLALVAEGAAGEAP